ncbi:MAG TPA: TolC family protein [Verrucomicrobiota bacterium]|jgi:outer membrane protein TolC|nr:TolC family protein [Verrucomicrobiota bacterium]
MTIAHAAYSLIFMQKHDSLQIDEQQQIAHPRRRMYLKKLFWAFTALSTLATAEAADIPNGAVTLEQCIQIALENNLNLRITNYQPRLAGLNLQGSYGAYDPRLSLGGTDSFRESKGRENPLEFTIPTSKTDSFRGNLGLNGVLLPSTGMRYNLGLNSSETTGTSASNFPFGSYGTGFFANLTQPLLKGAWIDGTRMSIKLNKQQIKNSSLTVIRQITQTVSSVELAYYALIASRENVTVAEETLALTEKNFSNQKRRAEVGTLAKSQLPQLEAELYSQKASLLSVQNSYADSVNNLKRFLTDDFASVQDAELLPVGELNPVQTVFSRNDSWAKALNQRPEILQSKISLENTDIRLKYNKNQLYPQLDLRATYGLSGSDSADVMHRYPDGTISQYPLRDPNTGKYVSRSFVNRAASFNTSFKDVREFDYPNYSIGLQFSIPIPNRSARANYKTAQLQKEQAVLQHKELEQSIMIEIDRLIRDAEYRFEQIEVTRQARLSSELALQNDTKRYSEGAVENYQVLQAQRDLTSRRYAEINAKVQYLTALSRLAQAEGSTLDNNNINVEIEEE